MKNGVKTVAIIIFFCYIIKAFSKIREFSSAGRASALQAEGHRFEPYNSHHICGSSSVVEHCLAKAGVAGPSPVSRSNSKGSTRINSVLFFYFRRRSLVVKQMLPKHWLRVRFPSPAPKINAS